MVLALLCSCVLVSLPVLFSMVVVRRSGVDISGPQQQPVWDNMRYVRWDEGIFGPTIRLARTVQERLQEMPAGLAAENAAGSPDTFLVWEIDIHDDL